MTMPTKKRIISSNSLKKCTLRKFGYSTKLNTTTRRKALKKAIREYGKLMVFRKLLAVQVLNKNRNPKVSAIYKPDKAW